MSRVTASALSCIFCPSVLLPFLLLGILVVRPAQAQIGGDQKVSDTEGGFAGTLNNFDFFGTSIANIGDLNGDENPEIAVGATFDDDGGGNDSARGAVWILFPNDDGTIAAQQKLSDTAGGFSGALDDDDHFGAAIARMGSLGGDPTLVAGADADDDGGLDRGAAWILDLNSNGTIADSQRISDTAGGFNGVLDDEDAFGSAFTNLGSLGGSPTLAVGADQDDDGGTNRGAVWILDLNADGTVAETQKISSTSGGFGGALDNDDRFGVSLARLGDLNGNGTVEIAVGADLDDDGGANRGAVWILSLRDDGTVANEQKISDTRGGFNGTLDDVDLFGHDVTRLGDLNGDGVTDLGVGVLGDDDGGKERGAFWILYLNEDGTVAQATKVSDTAGGFTGVLNDEDFFGSEIAALGDLNDDSVPDLAAGASSDDDGGENRGAVWMLFGEQALLPVELTSFEGVQTDVRSVQLSWTTASETNNAGFAVQHRGPGQTSWQQIGFVDSKAAGGTATTPHTYRFDTAGLSAGTHRFRLNQVDRTGQTHVHEAVRVNLEMQTSIALGTPAPNPVRGQATVSFRVRDAKETTVTLYNALGQNVRTVYRGTPSAGERHKARIDASTLSSGLYVLQLQSGGHTRIQRFTVVR